MQKHMTQKMAAHGLPELPAPEAAAAAWQPLAPAPRGAMRTYSVRELDRERGILNATMPLVVREYFPRHVPSMSLSL